MAEAAVGGYLEKRRGDVAKLREALAHGDYATIRTLGHQMAGTGGGYGFDPITDIGSLLEDSRSCHRRQPDPASIEDLDRYLNAVQVVVKSIAMKHFMLVLVLIGASTTHAAAAGCDRDCLRGFITQYLDALVAHNPKALPLDPKAALQKTAWRCV